MVQTESDDCALVRVSLVSLVFPVAGTFPGNRHVLLDLYVKVLHSLLYYTRSHQRSP